MTAAKHSLGGRVRMLREQQGISLESLAAEIGQTPEYLRSLESDELIPPVAMLLTLGRALDVESGELLKDEDENDAVRQRAEAVTNRTEHYSYEVLNPDPTHGHLKAFRVRIEPNSALEGPGYSHDGEEFEYVVAGQVTVTVGEEVHHLSAGDTLHFDSATTHHLRNEGQLPTELIVVLYTP